MKNNNIEIALTSAVVFLGVLVAAVLAPKNEYFFGNFIFYWLPQLIIISLLLILKYRLAVVSGCAFIMALYLVLYGAWVSSQPKDGLIWLGYVFSIPGAALGALAAGYFLKVRIRETTVFIAIAVTSLASAVGVIVNQAAVCSTVMYCGY